MIHPGVDDSVTLQQNDRHEALQQSTRARIARGERAPCGRYPYMASLRSRSNEHLCGGMLVAPLYVLTAAHCVDPNNDDTAGPQPIVVVGACNLDDEIGVKNSGGILPEIFLGTADIHKGYNSSVGVGGGFDLALVKLSRESKIKPVQLPHPSTATSRALVALGWGVQEDGSSPKDLKQATELHTLRNSICNSDEDAWPNINILDSMLCATGKESGQDACQGDSGGPLLDADAPDLEIAKGDPSLDICVAITSFGPRDQDCGYSTRPGVYTRLSSFHDWISETINAAQHGNGEKGTSTSVEMYVQESPWEHDDDDTDRRAQPTRTERGDSTGSDEMEVNHYEDRHRRCSWCLTRHFCLLCKNRDSGE